MLLNISKKQALAVRVEDGGLYLFSVLFLFLFLFLLIFLILNLGLGISMTSYVTVTN